MMAARWLTSCAQKETLNRVAAEYLYTRIKHLTPTLEKLPQGGGPCPPLPLLLPPLHCEGDKTANIHAPVLVKELQKLINRDNNLGTTSDSNNACAEKEAFRHWVFANKQRNDGLAIKLGTASTKLAKYSANMEYESELEAHLPRGP